MSRDVAAVSGPIKGSHAGGAVGNASAPARFLIEIPMDAYVRCLARCDEKSPEYVLLRNGIVVREDPHKVIVTIRCDADKARLIRRILVKECPELLDEVQFYPEPL
ncbi:MAG TPA: hypothetical protein VJQ55_11565 [Candidatus Binatia bacterium]|nr:hypothetical protein [Candidatus Binatia bacterium]